MNERQEGLGNLVYTLNVIKIKKEEAIEREGAVRKPLIEGINHLTLILKKSINYIRLKEENSENISFSLESIKNLWYDFSKNFLSKELNKYLDNYGKIGGMVMIKKPIYTQSYIFALQSFDNVSKLASEKQYGSEEFGMRVHNLRTWLEIIRDNHEELEREIIKN